MAMGQRLTIRLPATCRRLFCNSIIVVAGDFDTTMDEVPAGAVETMHLMAAGDGGRAMDSVGAMADGAVAVVAMAADDTWLAALAVCGL